MSLIDYLKLTYEWIVKQNTTSLRKTVKLHLCCSHMMHILGNDVNKLYGPNNESGKIIIETLASMFNIHSYNELIGIFKHICVIMLSKFKSSQVTLSLKILVKELANPSMLNLKEMLSNIDEEGEDIKPKMKPDPEINEFVNQALYKASPYFQDFNSIKQDVENELEEGLSLKEENEENNFFNPQMLNIFLKKFMPFLPLWSGL